MSQSNVRKRCVGLEFSGFFQRTFYPCSMPQRFSGVKMLIVDDEADLRNMVADHFSSHGAETREAANGTEAFEIYKTFGPQIVFTDMMMAKGSGVDLLKSIRSSDKGPQSLVVVMTGQSDNDLVKLKELGADSIVAKPYTLRGLVQLAQDLLKT